MGGDRHVMGLGQGGDLLHLGDAAAVAAVRLQHVHHLGLQDLAHLPDGAVPLARGQGHGDRLAHPPHDLDVARHPALLPEQQVIGLQVAPHLAGDGRRHLAVGVEHDDAGGADLGAALADAVEDPLHPVRGIAVGADAPGADLDRLGAGVHPHLVAAGSAEEPVHGHAVELAGDVPEGHVDGGDGVHHEAAAAQVSVGAEQPLPQVLDGGGVLADDHLAEGLGQGAGDAGLHVVDLAPAGDAVAGLDLHVPLGAHGDRPQGGDPDAGGAVFDGIGHEAGSPRVGGGGFDSGLPLAKNRQTREG